MHPLVRNVTAFLVVVCLTVLAKSLYGTTGGVDCPTDSYWCIAVSCPTTPTLALDGVTPVCKCDSVPITGAWYRCVNSGPKTYCSGGTSWYRCATYTQCTVTTVNGVSRCASSTWDCVNDSSADAYRWANIITCY